MPDTDDRAAVLEANSAFYRAFESLDLGQMEAVWRHASNVKCIHPGSGLLVGWGPVMDSWQRIFDNTLSMRFAPSEVYVEIVGDLAWAVLTETLESEHRDGKVAGRLLATNVFQRDGGRWLMVHHHVSPLDAADRDTGPEAMH